MKTSIETYFKFSDEEFCEKFSSCTLNPKLFNHEAHLRLGWILIKDLGLQKAEKEIEKQLLRFGTYNGVQDKYNQTVTIVAMRAINHFLSHSKTDDFKGFIDENSQLKTNFKHIVSSHYSFDIFTSEKARVEFLKPDVLSFD